MSWRDSLERRDEVRAAFREAYQLGHFKAGGTTAPIMAEDEAWKLSEARSRLELPLEPPPPMPQTIPASAGLASHQSQVGEAATRALGSATNSHYAKGSDSEEP